MISQQQWDGYTNAEKLDYLFRWTLAAENASASLAASVQALHDQAKTDAKRQETDG